MCFWCSPLRPLQRPELEFFNGLGGFAEWGQVFGDPVIATALLDRLLHHAVVVHIEGSSYRMREHADLLPPVQPPGARPDAQPKRRGRPPKAAAIGVA